MVQSPKGLRALGAVLIASFLSGGALEIYAAQAQATKARAQALQPTAAAKRNRLKKYCRPVIPTISLSTNSNSKMACACCSRKTLARRLFRFA